MAGATDLLALERGYQPFDISSTQPQPKKRGNLFTKLLPAIGGAAGIALAPFTGGGSLALLGLGALGGAAGKVIENKTEGLDAFHNPGQIALEGLFGAGGGALTALKAARAGKAAITAERALATGGAEAAATAGERGIADTALKTASAGLQAPTVSSLIPKTSIRQRVLNASEGLKGEARGIKPGVTVPGTSKRLTGGTSDQINKYIDSLGGAKSAHRQYRVVQADLQRTGERIGNLVTQHDRPLAVTDMTKITTSAADRAKNALGFKPEDQVISDVKSQLGEAKSLTDLRRVRSNLDDALQNFYKQTERDSSTTATMKVVKGYRDGIDKVLTESIPGFKEVNTRYATALKASEQLLSKANPNGLRFFGIQTGIGGEGLQAAKDLAGRAVGKVGGIIPEAGAGGVSGATGNIMNLIKPVAGQEVIHAGGNVALGRGPFGQQPPVDMNGNLTPEQAQSAEARTQETLLASLTPEQRTALAAESQAAGGGAGAAGAPGAGGADTGGMTYEQLTQLVAQDPKNASTYIALYKAQPQDKANKPLSSAASKDVSNAETGIRGISDLQGMLQQDPGVIKRTLVPGRGLFGGFLGNVVDTNGFDAARQQIVDVIARLRTGAAISKSEESRFLKFLPQPFDSPTVAQQKLGYLERQFQRVAAADPAAGNEIQQVFNGQSAGDTAGLQ